VAPLTRAVIGLQERLRTGTAKNGVRVATVSSSSPVAVAVLRLQPGPGGQVRAAVPLLADVAARSLGSSGRVEVDVDVDGDGDGDGDGGDGHIAIVMVAPASNPDGPVRAADAVLKALRAKVPAATAWPTPAVFDAGLDGDSDDIVVPVLTLPTTTAVVAPVTASDVQGALLALAALTPAQVSLGVVGPGRPDDLVKKAASLLSAPLAKVPVPPVPPTAPRATATATPITTAPTAPTATPPTVTAVLVPRPAAALDRVALRVVSTLLAGRVVRMGDAMGLVPGATGRSSVEGMSSVPPPLEVVADAAAREQRRQLAGLDDVARVAARAARDLLAGDAPFAELQAAAVVSPDDVSRLARSLLSGTRSVITVPPSAPAPPSPSPSSSSKSTVGSAVDVVDGLPWAVAVVPGGGPWSVAGPCGPRRGGGGGGPAGGGWGGAGGGGRGGGGAAPPTARGDGRGGQPTSAAAAVMVRGGVGHGGDVWQRLAAPGVWSRGL
jgi:hypothetical protein